MHTITITNFLPTMPKRPAVPAPTKIAPPIDDDLNHWSTERIDRALAAGKAVPRKEKLEVRSSPIHGKGVFARVPFKKGEVVLEYLGAIIDWPEALRRHPHDPSQPNHTFYFALDDEGGVIDGNDGGNRARWINHSCAPNCESETKGQRVWVRALRDMAAGAELNYDYALVIDEPLTPQLKKDYACRCGSKKCRGTLLALED
jgi:hypothetical protein